MAVLARGLPPREPLRASVWRLGAELGLADMWRAAGGVAAVLHGVSTGISCAPAGLRAATTPDEVPELLEAAVSDIASALSHADGFLYIALRPCG